MKHAPSTRNPSDEWEPTNKNLWERVLEVASGERRQLTQGDRTINSPNNGRGFKSMPANPMGIGWAVKQYNGFGGNWRSKQALQQMRLGAVIATASPEAEHEIMVHLQRQGVVRLASATSQAPYWHYWEITAQGNRMVTAGLGEDLERKMTELLSGDYDDAKAKAIGQWLGANFRVDSPKTPPGQKKLKEQVKAIQWYLTHGGPSYRNSIEVTWESSIRPALGDLVRYFTNEGGKIVPKELAVGGRLYINDAGFDEAALKKYADRLEKMFLEVKGWRTKALQGSLKVVLANPRNFRGTAGGKYRASEDAMYVRATPNVLKRGAGYGSFEYILVHELGHRYERKVSLSTDFDSWHTSRYSFKEGEAFAELFAIGHFGLTGAWDAGRVDKFERLMSGSSEESRLTL